MINVSELITLSKLIFILKVQDLNGSHIRLRRDNGGSVYRGKQTKITIGYIIFTCEVTIIISDVIRFKCRYSVIRLHTNTVNTYAACICTITNF